MTKAGGASALNMLINCNFHPNNLKLLHADWTNVRMFWLMRQEIGELVYVLTAYNAYDILIFWPSVVSVIILMIGIFYINYLINQYVNMVTVFIF